MKIIRHYTNVIPDARGGVIAIGNFDGVHRGHQAVVARSAALADEMGVPLGVMIFEPHPREYFAPDAPPFRLTSFHSKARLLERLGVDVLYVVTFDAQMANMSAQDFVLNILVKGLGMVHVVVGYDFRFGRGRAGDVAVLHAMGEMEGFGLTVVEPVVHPGDNAQGGKIFSSTLIREYIGSGQVGAAADLLGHWWAIEGHVLHGDHRGREIGFPTINVALGPSVVPALGTYAVWVEVHEAGAAAGLSSARGNSAVYPGVAYVGRRPTFAKNEILLEAHLFGFSGDLYGRQVRVSFVDFVRPERTFDGLDALKAQITRDKAKAEHLLKAPNAQLDIFEEGFDAIVGPSRREA